MAAPWYRLPFQEAIDYLLEKEVVTRAEFDAINQWARLRAFTVTGIAKLDVIQSVLDGLTEVVRSGGTLEDFEAKLDDVFEAAGLEPLAPSRVETIFRTNIQAAYGRGLWEQANDPEIRDDVWGWRYHTAGDDRVRPEHEELDGKEFQMGAGDTYWPPWDYNCRCDAEILTVAEAEEAGLVSSDVPEAAVKAAVESDFASPAISDEYVPDLGGYDPQAVHDYLKDGLRRG